MTNADKAKAIVKCIKWRLEEAVKESAKLKAEDAAGAAYERAMEEAKKKYGDEDVGWGPPPKSPEGNTYHQDVRDRAARELAACQEIFDYAVEVFLSKIPEDKP